MWSKYRGRRNRLGRSGRELAKIRVVLDFFYYAKAISVINLVLNVLPTATTTTTTNRDIEMRMKL